MEDLRDSPGKCPGQILHAFRKKIGLARVQEIIVRLLMMWTLPQGGSRDLEEMQTAQPDLALGPTGL